MPHGEPRRHYLAGVILGCAALWWGGMAAGQSVSFALNDRGLKSLAYNGWEFIGDSSYQGDFSLWGTSNTFSRPDGTTYQDATAWTSSSMDYSARKITKTYPWGVITCTYSSPTPTQISFHIAITNTKTTDTLVSAGGKLIVFDTPIANPDCYDATFGHLKLAGQPRYADPSHQPGVLFISLGSTGNLAICNDNAPTTVSKVGNLWQFNGTQRFDLSWSANDPVAPGATGTFDISLRFGPSTTTQYDLAADVYQRFDYQFPLQWNWPDRRMMGCDFLSSSVPHPANGKNPRGWFNNDATVDVTTAAGLADFQTRMLARVDAHILQLQQKNCQGLIIWDIEGQEYPHAISYCGDPDMVFTLAPEMAYTGTHTLCVADEIFKKYRDAGFKVGVCVRPQKMTPNGSGGYTQVLPADPGQEIYDDVTYAINRWGCSVFYVDSTVFDGGGTIPATYLFQRTLDAYPNILLCGENQTPKYYGYGTPYDQLNFDAPGTSARPYIDAEYRGAATMLKMYDYTAANHDAVLASIRRGDILIANSWYPDPDLLAGKALYDEMGTRPTVTISLPTNNTTFNTPASITVTAAAACVGKTIQKVEFYAGPVKIGEATTAPYSIVWTGFTLGSNYCLYAKAITTDACSAVTMPTRIRVTNTQIQDQSITFGAVPDPTYGDAPFALNATASSGLPVSFSLLSGPATLVGNTVTLTGAGTVTVRASQAGNATYNPGPAVDRTFTVQKAVVTCRADDKARAYGSANPAFTVSYAGFVNGDGPTSLARVPTASCAATPASPAGSYPIVPTGGTANNYSFAYVNGTLTVGRADQAIAFSALPKATLGQPAFALQATATSGLPVSFVSSNPAVAAISGNTVTIKSIGTTTITATQGGNANWNPAPTVARDLVVLSPMPDFIVTDIRLDPAVPAIGGVFTAYVTVQNHGSKSARAGYLYAWVNRAAAATGALTPDKSASVGTLRPGQTKTIQLSLLKTGTTAGARTFRAFVDARNATAEIDDTNNQATLAYAAGWPNFVITDVAFSPDPPKRGGRFTAYVTVQNVGEATASAGYLDVWANRGAPVIPSSTVRGDKYATVGTLTAGQSKTLTVTGLSAGSVAQTRTFQALVESRAKTLESNETDNGLLVPYAVQ